jgi:hypothetical protein
MILSTTSGGSSFEITIVPSAVLKGHYGLLDLSDLCAVFLSRPMSVPRPEKSTTGLNHDDLLDVLSSAAALATRSKPQILRPLSQNFPKSFATQCLNAQRSLRTRNMLEDSKKDDSARARTGDRLCVRQK